MTASAAAVYTPVATTELSGIDPRAWLADVLARIADHPGSRLGQLLPGIGKDLPINPLPEAVAMPDLAASPGIASAFVR